MTILHRLFYALLPPDPQRDQIDRIGRSFGDTGRVRRDRLHVTLWITEDFPALPMPLADSLIETASTVQPTGFDLTLDRVSGSPSSIALRPRRIADPFRRFQRDLGLAQDERRLRPRRGWAFNPHVTLLYRNGQPFSRAIGGLGAVGWRPQEFVLIHSEVGATRHHILASWPIAPAPDLFG